MSRGSWLALIMCGGLFLLAAFRVIMPRSGGSTSGGERVVRFAHFRLEEPIIAALNTLAREYEQMHPGVRLEQIAVPLRGWRAWLNAQLVGGMAPDLVYLFALQTEMYPRHFLPLSEAVMQPNRYNEGSPLAGMPWRDTFVDGLDSEPNFNTSLQDRYGIPLSMATWRLLYNRDLLAEIGGADQPPHDLRSFLALCDVVRAHGQRTGRPLVPIAGSGDRTLPAMDRLFQSQTQRLSRQVDRSRHLSLGFADMGLAYLRGEWDFGSPGVRGGLELWRDYGRWHQPGFLQSRQEDATFLFLQQRALMVSVISWDYINLRELAPFAIGVVDLPFAEIDNQRLGANTLGPNSEAAIGLRFSFGIVRYSEHPDVALDFLRYLTSAAGNGRFAALSGNLPAIVGLPVEPDLRAFAPNLDGSAPGFRIVRGTPQSGPATNRLIETELHRLVAEQGSVEGYIAEIAPRYERALRTDLGREVRDLSKRVRQEDSILAGLETQAEADAGAVSQRWETQAQQEAQAAQIAYGLAEVER